ncbi:MAG: SIR2 family protein [Bacteroidia bacterium]
MKTEFIQNSLDQIINDIQSNNLVIYCGAGISRDSGIPVVNELVPYILEKLKIESSDILKIYDPISGLKIPFESFMEIIHTNVRAYEIFKIFEKGLPNHNHLVIANLMQKGLLNYVVTTNFDRLQEEANTILNLSKYDLISSENQFEKLIFNGLNKAIIKIHGSVDNIDEMVITLQQVSAHKSITSRKHVINETFSTGNHKSVLILGYSSSDVFDLSVYIESIKSNFKNIYYIEHYLGDPYTEEVSIKKERNPFKLFNGFRLYCNTSALVNYISNRVLNLEVSASENKTFNWKKNIDIWFSRIEIFPCDKYSFLGELFNIIGHFDLSIKYYLLYLNSLTDNYYRIQVLAKLIDCYRLNSQHVEAIKAAKEALEINDPHYNLTIIILLSGIYLDKGELQDAELSLIEALNYPNLMDHQLSNIYSISAKINQQKVDYKKAIVDIKKAIEYKMKSESFTLNDELELYGDLALYLIGNDEFDKGIPILKNLLKKSNDLNDKLKITSFKSDLGWAYYKSNDLSSMNTFIIDLPGMLAISTEDRNLARFHYVAGKILLCKLYDPSKAIEHFNQALKYSTQNKNRRMICMNYTNLGGSHCISAINMKDQSNGVSNVMAFKYHLHECNSNLMNAIDLIRDADTDIEGELKYYLELQKYLLDSR